MFSFSDLIAGTVKTGPDADDRFVLTTSDGQDCDVAITATTYAELTRNLGEGYLDCTGQVRQLLMPGKFVFAYGIFYPEPGAPFEAKHLVFSGRNLTEFAFERQNWWIQQIRSLGEFYLKAQFGDGPLDWRNYTTMLDLYGHKTQNTRQETDTISRLVYGFASAYHLTGDERFLEAAESGSAYLREHFRAEDTSAETVYWYHAVEFAGGHAKRKLHSSGMAEIPGMRKGHTAAAHERKMLSSEFGDDYDAIPAYEQIYALAGPTQTYRLTGDPAIRHDIDCTINLFNRYFRDHEKGGYFSHIDPVTFDPRAESLGGNRARKNWNSVGDHAPAYLINLVLATGDPEHIKMLVDTADTITEHFQDYEHAAFVQEKFHEDWSHDSTWGWQQDRGVIGHNLKIAWNLMRIKNVNDDQRYQEFAEKIAELMPAHGYDGRRTGWYDVVERGLDPGQSVHRYAWHDRKAWWQQEQGILAYLILDGMLGKPEYLKYARESCAFYNAFFLDHDSGAVYFNVLASGIPYLLGTERNKGSHSMSGYHSFELCYLAAVYTNLLITKQPMDLYFKPLPGALHDGVLRVAPDLLPPGSVEITEVTVDGMPHLEFDAKQLTVAVPKSEKRVTVKVRLTPTSGQDHFTAAVEVEAGRTRLQLTGELDHRAVPALTDELRKVVAASAEEVLVDMSKLLAIDDAALRAMVFAKQKLADDVAFRIFGASDEIRNRITAVAMAEELEFV
jgi:anti-anti-sigma factor